MKELQSQTFLDLVERLNKELCYYEELCAKANHYSKKISGLDNIVDSELKPPLTDNLISILESLSIKISSLNTNLSGSLINIEKVVNI